LQLRTFSRVSNVFLSGQQCFFETSMTKRPEEVLADSGYCSEGNLKYLAKRRMEGFVATEKQKHGERSEPCKRGPLPKDASRVERMGRKLKTKVGVAVYARRKCMVEPVFGQIKQARGFRQFLLRGLLRVIRYSGRHRNDGTAPRIGILGNPITSRVRSVLRMSIFGRTPSVAVRDRRSGQDRSTEHGQGG
jgi:hypothetical protein